MERKNLRTVEPIDQICFHKIYFFWLSGAYSGKIVWWSLQKLPE